MRNSAPPRLASKNRREFNPQAFLATIGEGRKAMLFPKKQTIFAQGIPHFATCFATLWQPAIRSRQIWQRETPLHFQKYRHSYPRSSRPRSINHETDVRDSSYSQQPAVNAFRADPRLEGALTESKQVIGASCRPISATASWESCSIAAFGF
jgi:hypothetical protein